jgi:hypothetical protein
MQNPVRIFSIGIPLLLAGFAIGYALRGLPGRPAINGPTVVQTDGRAPPRANLATSDHADRVKAESVDFESLIQEAMQNRWSDDSESRLRRGIDALSLSEIQPALKALKGVADFRERSGIFKQILRRWAEMEPRKAFDYLNSLGEGEIKSQTMTEVAKIVARTDPEYLASEAESMPASRARRELVQELTKAWSEKDVRAALSWAQRLPEDQSKQDALAIIRFAWAAQNPAEAASQLSELPAGDSRNSLLTAIAERWGSSNPEAAMEWVRTLSQPEQALAAPCVIGAWAERDPLAAGEFVAGLPQDETQNRAALLVISSWANRDPEQAITWVLRFPEGPTREQGLREAVSGWTRMDSEAARMWVQHLPAGDTRDAALKDYVESIAYWAPNKAAGSIDLIAEPAKREEAVAITLRSWAELDPMSARNWIAGSAMPQK